jgi:cell division protein FtsI (penicillin-binding protein 3)
MVIRFWRDRSPSRRDDSRAEQAAEEALRLSEGNAGRDPLRAPAATDPRFELQWRHAMRKRVVIVLSLLGLWTAVVEARLVRLQIMQHEEMLGRARHQQESSVKLIPPRGDIVDRNGGMLAFSVEGHALGADPTAVGDRADAVNKLCAALGDCTKEKTGSLLRNLARPGFFAYLDRQISPDQAARIEALKLPGIRVIPEPRRYYPKFDLAAHVLGFVGIDNDGLGGVERVYDNVIRGSEGRMLLYVDARRKRLDSRIQISPKPGATVELTIDTFLQHIAERELRAGVEEARAAGGTAIVMDPHNGEILALASYPTFNPNAVQQFGEDAKRDRAIQDVYEPGSTFKIVTASAALEEQVLHLDDMIDTNPGVISFPGRKPITEAKHHNYGVLSVQDVVVKSSNIGAIKIGLKVGPDRMSRYVQRFGFGQALLPDLAGQSRGIVWSSAKLNESALASISMGYQVGVTPLQMVTAASVVANGGTLYEPHLVRATLQDDRRVVVAPKALRQAISPETAAMLTTIMEGVVERGTGDKARLSGFQVAGKTGTAAKLVNGRYSSTDYNCSFVGFVPSRQPVFAILVVIDTPRNGSPYGGTIAAPVFARIADAALRQLGVPPTINPPPVVLASNNSGMSDGIRRVGGAVAAHAPTPFNEPSIMPDVRGLSVRDALRTLAALGLTVRVHGTGLVADQSPEPGESIDNVEWSTLELRRGSQ